MNSRYHQVLLRHGPSRVLQRHKGRGLKVDCEGWSTRQESTPGSPALGSKQSKNASVAPEGNQQGLLGVGRLVTDRPLRSANSGQDRVLRGGRFRAKAKSQTSSRLI